jgi:hypothetical protein
MDKKPENSRRLKQKSYHRLRQKVESSINHTLHERCIVYSKGNGHPIDAVRRAMLAPE